MTQDDATRLFYEYLWPHRAMVLRTAQFLTRNHAEADDLAQETLVKAFRSIAQIDTSAGGGGGRAASAKPWLSAILRNTRIDRMRTLGRHPADRALSIEHEEFDAPAPPSAIAEPAPDVADPAALLEQFSDADLIRALRTLPEEIRWTLLLVDVEQIDQADAAQILGIPEGTVKSRAHRGRRMLRERLASHAAASPQLRIAPEESQ
jgi:RNA polymerase sigma-70 factor (ECF subfamily)